MSTYTQIIYHIIFGTKYHQQILHKANRQKLFQYITGILQNKNCHLYQINGIENHIHILFHLHPTIALSDIVKDIKLASSKFIKENNLFTDFIGWQNGYGAFTYSISAKQTLIAYIQNQEEHHKVKSFREEFIQLLKDNGIDFDEKYLL
jgi:REP element-mobilizing transposase RayT